MESGSRQNTAKLKKQTASQRAHAKKRRIAFGMILFLALITAFVGGFALRSNVPLVSSMGFVVSESELPNSTSGTQKTTYDALSARISEVEDILENNSMDSIGLQDATRQMLGDLMDATQDPFATYYNAERYEAYIQETAHKQYSGIGVLFGDFDGRACVVDVLEGSEAQARGVTQGDFVVAIDGDSSHKWSAIEVIGSLDREEGDSVIITWMRPISKDAERGDEFTTTLVCKQFKEDNVTTSIDGDVGCIKLRQLTSDAAELVQGAVEFLADQGVKSIVLDIRDNPGGYLTQSLDIASLFVTSGVLVGIQTNDGVSTRNASGTVVSDAPLVVLMNEYTCAAAEVLAAALQDNQRSTSVGQTTMGKGSVQVVRELSFGGAIRYTAAYYLTPLGHEINGVGVIPNITVANDPSDSETDNQLNVAIDVARSLIEG